MARADRMIRAMIVAAAGMVAAPAPAGIDDLRVLLASNGPVLRDWDPAGVRAPRLAPGEAVLLHLAGGRDLRVSARDAAGALVPLRFGLGNGGGLRRVVEPRMEQGAYVLPAAPDPRIVELRRPAGPGAAIPLAIATGAFVMDDAGYGYAREVPLDAPRHRLLWQEPRHQDIRLPGDAPRQFGPRLSARADQRDYVLAEPGASLAFAVEGPQRLRLETRLLREETDALYRPYRIDWTLDGQARRAMTFEAAWDLRRAYRWADGSTAAVTGAQTGYLDVPPGRHVVSLVPSRQMLLRADAFGGTLSAPRANAAPGLDAALDAAARIGQAAPADILMGVMQGAPQSRVATRALTPGVLEPQLRALARSNSYSGGGLLAADTLRARALELPQVTAVSAAAERFSGAYGFYRMLEPLNGTSGGAALWDMPPQLDEPGQSPRTGPGEGVPDGVLLTGILSGRFHELRPGQGLSYVVPERSASARLRLIVARDDLAGPVRLRLAADAHPPIVLEFDPDGAGLFGLLVASPAEQGLRRAAERRGLSPEALAARVLAAQGMPEARRARLVALDLALDHPVSRLRLSAESATGRPLRVALAARASRQSQLDAPAFLALRNRLGAPGARHLFFHGLRAALDCAPWLNAPAACRIAPVGGDLAAQAELYNELVPILRLLRSREELVFGPVRGTPGPAVAQGDGAGTAPLLAGGREALQAGNPLGALERFTRARAVARGGDGAAALLGQVAALDALGEPFLPERMLRQAGMACTATGAAARVALDARYAQRADIDRQLGVEARGLICAGEDRRDLDRLAALLAAAGRDGDALRMAALAARPPAAPLGAAAAREGWPGAPDLAALAPGHPVGAAGLVQRSAGAIPVRVPARDLVTTLYRATPGTPVVLAAPGQGVVQLTIRPIHGADASGRISGAVTFETGGGTEFRMVADNPVSPGLVDLTGAGALGAGTDWSRTVAAGERITVRPQGMAVGVEARFLPGAAAPPRGAPATVVSELSRLLFEYRADSVAQAALLPRAARLGAPGIAPAAEDPEVRRLWATIRARSSWERITRVTTSAGITEAETPGLPFDSPNLRARAILAEGFDPAARTLPSEGALTIRRQGAEAVRLSGMLSMSVVAASPVGEAIVAVTDGSGAVRRIRLGPDRREAELSLDFAAGDSAAQLRLEQSSPNSFVQLRLDDADGEAEERSRVFDVATAGEPVRYVPAAPEVVRVDEWRDGQMLTRMVLAAPDAPLVLQPEAGRPRALVRLFRLVPDPGGVDLPVDTEAETEAAGAEAVAAARTMVDRPPRTDLSGPLALSYPEAVLNQRRIELEPGRPGTWSLGLRARRSADANSDDGAQAAGELQFSARHRRYWSGPDLYTDAEGFARPRRNGPVVYGLSGLVTWPERFGGTTFSAEAALLAQTFDDTAWRLRLALAAERDFALSDRLDLGLAGGFFVQALQPGGARDAPRDEVDTDVYSSYLDTHRSGLSAAAALDWQPYDDLRLFAGTELRGNAAPDLLSLDQLRFEAGLRQYLRGLRYGVIATHRVFLKDSDRSAQGAWSRIALEATWESWLPGADRLEIGGVLARRSDLDGITGELFLTWHFGGGFEDFAPDAVAFRGLREDARYGWLEERYGN
ncbi:hypothetical protein [Marinibacterium profundimaris]|nr:hypothetical protein [Marinibacterium profundimaris]